MLQVPKGALRRAFNTAVERLPLHGRPVRPVVSQIFNPWQFSTTRAMATKQVYQYDERARAHPARIRAIRSYSALGADDQALCKTATEKTHALETDETIFFVQGGGQPSDTGYMTSSSAEGKQSRFDVEVVRYGLGGAVLHFGHFRDESTPFEVGQAVEQHVDDQKRNLNSRIHTAGHLVGLAVRHLASDSDAKLDVLELKAQHYPGASFVEFRGVISSDFKDAIQSKCSQYVDNALPVKLHWYKPDELTPNGVITVEGMPIVAGADGNVRVVDIVGAGAYPCGGTHVPDTSHVGKLVVRNIKRQKGISKVSYAIEDAKN